METVSYTSYYDERIIYNHKCLSDIESRYTAPQTHSAIEFIYLKKGSITYTVDEKTYKVEPHSLIITWPRKIHTITFQDPSLYERYDVIFDEKLIFPPIYEKIKSAPDVINCKKFPNIYEFFKRIDVYCKYFPEEEVGNLLAHLVDELAYNVLLAIENITDHEKIGVDSVFSKVLEYIENNLTNQITVKNICSEFYISASYLHNLFAEHLNTTPKKYIDLKRLALVQHYLSQGELATHIYEKCGFSDYSAFYRSYKKHFGYPPSAEKDRVSVDDIVF